MVAKSDPSRAGIDTSGGTLSLTPTVDPSKAPPPPAGRRAASAGASTLSSERTAFNDGQGLGSGTGTISLAPAAPLDPDATGVVSPVVGGPPPGLLPAGDGTLSVAPAAPLAPHGAPHYASAPSSSTSASSSSTSPTREASALANLSAASTGGSGRGGLPVVGDRFGPYLLLGELGRGAMGVVFRALHEALNREVALKLMLAQETTEEQRTRFLREAEASAALIHPGIVQVHDVGITDGKLYFSMDFVEGSMLKEVMQEHDGDWGLLAKLLARVCDAVAYAHRKGVIHRDLKPHNVMVDLEFTPRVMDFGLARLDEDRPDPSQRATGKTTKQRAKLTRMGAVMGTPVYMPPEQATGRTEDIDTRSDIYSLGVILYVMLAGEPPFRAPSLAELVMQIDGEEPLAPSAKRAGCPWELERIALKAIAKRREDRYQTASDLRDDLEAWLTGRPVAAVEGGAVYRANKFIRRNPTLVSVSAAAVLAIASLAGWQVNEAQARARRQQEQVATLLAGAEEKLAAADTGRRAAEAHPALAERPGEVRPLLAGALASYAEALTRLAAAAQLDPQSPRIAELSLDAELAQQAAKALEADAIRREAALEEVQRARLRARGAVDEALALLADIDPGTPTDLAGLSALRERVGALRAALVGALPSLAGDPGARRAEDGLARVVELLTAMDGRAARLSQAARLAALRAEADEALRRADTELAEAAARERLGEALASLAEALRLDPQDAGLRKRRADAALALGERALAGRELDFAAFVVGDARALDPARVQAFLDRVQHARMDLDRYQKALEEAESARAGERWSDAARFYRDAVQAAPGRPEAAFGAAFSRGGLAAAEGRYEEALGLFAEAEPQAVRPFDQGALVLATKRVRAQWATSLVEAGEASLKAARWAEAERQLARAVELDPEHADARRLLDEVTARRRVPTGMVLIPDGPFTFGRPAEAREGVACGAVYLARTEVNNREYAAFVQAGGYRRPALWDPEAIPHIDRFVDQTGRHGPMAWSNGRPPEGVDELPVTGVSYFEARAYTRWRGQGYRLPTEVEWEKAATWDAVRAERIAAPWIVRGADGVLRSSWEARWRAYFHRAAPKPVGAAIGRDEGGAPLYDAAPSGVLDLWGNAREWVVVPGAEAIPRPGLRGGSFASRYEERAMPYGSYLPDGAFRAHDTGFRVARDAVLEGAGDGAAADPAKGAASAAPRFERGEDRR